jgi:Cdc6-like AAA superfamily ATPase
MIIMNSTGNSWMERVKSRFPGRESQIERLVRYMGYVPQSLVANDKETIATSTAASTTATIKDAAHVDANAIGEAAAYEFDPLVASLYIYGHSGTGKTTVVKTVLDEMHKNNMERLLVAFVNCVECGTRRMIYSRALYQWFGIEVVCDQTVDFVRYIMDHTTEEQSLILVRM